MPYWDTAADVPHVITNLPERRSQVSPYASLSDPATARLLGGGEYGGNYSGEHVGETSALSLSTVFRAVSLISQSIATLPLKTFRKRPDGQREQVASFLDDPYGEAGAGDVYLTPFAWKETVLLHLVLLGEAFLRIRKNQAGATIGLEPIHPLSVAVEADPDITGGKVFYVALKNGERTALFPDEMIHVVGPNIRGLRGYSFLTMGRNSLGMTLAAERSAANMFRDGAMVNGVLTPAAGEDLSAADVDAIRADLDKRLYGRKNAGTVPIINRVLEFNAWQMTNADAQWIESRQFQIEEVSRWTGVPPFLLMQMEKQTSWGTGIAEQNTNLGQYVLNPWCVRLTDWLETLLPDPRYPEFDFAGLYAGSAEQEITSLMAQVNGGMITLNEARAKRNLTPLPGGDQLRIPSGVMLQAQLEASAAATEAALPDPNGAPASGA